MKFLSSHAPELQLSNVGTRIGSWKANDFQGRHLGSCGIGCLCLHVSSGVNDHALSRLDLHVLWRKKAGARIDRSPDSLKILLISWVAGILPGSAGEPFAHHLPSASSLLMLLA